VPRTVILVAAEAHEFSGLIRRLRRTARLNWRVEFARVTQVNGERWILAANGPGPRLAGDAVDIAYREDRPDAIVSAGLCGALDPRFRIGQIVVASEIAAGDERYAALAPAAAQPCERGIVVSIDRVAVTASDKSRLWQSGACAVEMEAAAVGLRASSRGTPFYCVRAVSDLAGEDLPLDFNQLRNGSGRFNRVRILQNAMTRPWERIPALMRLGRNSWRAARALGDFLADCRF
jgi:adenosylhomocysteine nucleosidase